MDHLCDCTSELEKKQELRMTTQCNGNPLQYYCLENPMDRGAW